MEDFILQNSCSFGPSSMRPGAVVELESDYEIPRPAIANQVEYLQVV